MESRAVVIGISNVSSNLRPGICTSTTRPTTPYEGQVIYETDTNRVLVWDNAAWVMIADTDHPPALQLIKTQTIGTTVPTVDVTSCFSSDYDNYLIQFSGVTASVNGNALWCKLLSGTTPTINGMYGNTYYVVNAASSGLTVFANSNASYAEVGNLTTASTNHGSFEVQGPFLASYTRINFFGADNNYLRWASTAHRATTSYDGFQIYPASGTLTGGTICVYGYRKS